MHIEQISFDRLIPYARNSRTHSEQQVAQIAASITEFGFTNPVLIDAEGGIIAGHGRVMAARQLGLAEVPCIRLGHLSEAQKRAYVIADNKLALNAGWDESVLAAEMLALQEMDFDLGLLGFDDDEMSEILGQLKDPDIGANGSNIDDAPDIKPTPTSRTDDVWVLGQHRVICGDSTSASNLQRLLMGGGR